MATRNVKHNNKDYVIEADQLPSGKFITRIDPAGGIGHSIRGVDIQTTDPNGKTVSIRGRCGDLEVDLAENLQIL